MALRFLWFLLCFYSVLGFFGLLCFLWRILIFRAPVFLKIPLRIVVPCHALLKPISKKQQTVRGIYGTEAEEAFGGSGGGNVLFARHLTSVPLAFG